MQPFTPVYSPFLAEFMSIFIPVILVIVLWTIVLKGYSLWYAARAGQKWWFIALLVINTMGILEIIYLLGFRPKSPKQEKEVEPAPIHTSSEPAP